MPYRIKVFVTYAWDSEEHNSRVIDFTNMLRRNVGLEAELDRSITQQATATDFGQMMEMKITQADKVVVVLSPTYRKKAETFAGGVGKEYRRILADIDDNPSKYVLVSFLKRLDKATRKRVAPLAFRERDIVNLYQDQQLGFRSLIAKLTDQLDIEMATINNEMPLIEARPVGVFDLQRPKKRENEYDGREDLLGNFVRGVMQDSYFDRYEREVACRYTIIDELLAIEKQVKTRITLINPLEDFIEEAKFFTPYRFGRIAGIPDEKLLRLNKFIVKVDGKEIDMKDTIVIKDSRGSSRVYDDAVQIQYRQLIDNREKDLAIVFDKKLEIQLEETRIVPRNDTVFLKRINKLTRNFKMEYSFPDFDGEITGSCFSSTSSREQIVQSMDDKRKSISIQSNGWLLPGDGVFILAKRNNYLP
ncbi:MAG: SEFIR domain-containing protein [Bacteroidota bacterium]